MLWRNSRILQIYGANTNVGKSVVSTLVCKALKAKSTVKKVFYLKPISTGPAEDDDSRHIYRFVPGIKTHTLYQFKDPVSPHLAAHTFHPPGNQKFHSPDLKDQTVLQRVTASIESAVIDGVQYALVETAGGPLSPTPSGSLQADLYRPLRLPVILVGDSQLGGIGATLSAFESLYVRGYDVDSVMLFRDEKFGNYEYLRESFHARGIDTFAVDPPPSRHDDPKADFEEMCAYYETTSRSEEVGRMVELIDHKHQARINKLASMSSKAESFIWHPFRQHAIPQKIIAIDSAYGDFFQSPNDILLESLEDNGDSELTNDATSSAESIQKSILNPLFDGSASWWTQGLGHGNADLALTAAHAAGRYGHVMFASAIHAPALDISTKLLSLLQNPRLSRVFFSDNGSTGVEVALKMALRSSSKRYNWGEDDEPLGVLGFKGSYHGDCIATMNCSEPGVYNETVNWYQPWGWWFDPPSLQMRNGSWLLDVPAEIGGKRATFRRMEDIFDYGERERLGHTAPYQAFILSTLTRLIREEGHKFGALICEPILMGAGGMIFVDPLFQRVLIQTIRANPALFGTAIKATKITKSDSRQSHDWTGLPIIADEVFTGLYRLGRASSMSFLSKDSSGHAVDADIAPDISIHAKLLTGGLLPLAITAASESIFETFLSEKKQDALLHGHSYTAHAVGCSVAEKSLTTLEKLDQDGSWQIYKDTWESKSTESSAEKDRSTPLWSFWNQDTVRQLSGSGQVDGVFALGSVLAIYMRSEAGKGGYTSNAAAKLQNALLQGHLARFGVHSRVLGNVLYLMASMTSKPESLADIEGTLLRSLVR